MSAGRDAADDRGSTVEGEPSDAESSGVDAGSGADAELGSTAAEDMRSDGASVPAALTATFDYEAARMDDSPARLSAAIAVGAALVAAAASAFSVAALGVGTLGAAVVGVALFVGSRRVLGLGVFGVLGGVGVAGLTGAPPEPLLVASAAAAVAWGVGENAIGMGEQLGRGADTTRAELVHAGGTIAVTGLAAVVATVAYRLSGPRPSLALVTLLLGAVLLVLALGD